MDVMLFAEAAAGMFFPLKAEKNEESLLVKAPELVNAFATQGRPRFAVHVAAFDAVAERREPVYPDARTVGTLTKLQPSKRPPLVVPPSMACPEFEAQTLLTAWNKVPPLRAGLRPEV